MNDKLEEYLIILETNKDNISDIELHKYTDFIKEFIKNNTLNEIELKRIDTVLNVNDDNISNETEKEIDDKIDNNISNETEKEIDDKIDNNISNEKYNSYFSSIEGKSYNIEINSIKYKSKFKEDSLVCLNKSGIYEIPFENILNYNSMFHGKKMKVFEKLFFVFAIFSLNFLISIIWLKLFLSLFFLFFLLFPFLNKTGDKFIFLNIKYKIENINDNDNVKKIQINNDVKKIQINYYDEEFYNMIVKNIKNYKRFIKIFK